MLKNVLKDSNCVLKTSSITQKELKFTNLFIDHFCLFLMVEIENNEKQEESENTF